MFCKYILGAHSKISNFALGEFGRYPLYNDICENIVKLYLQEQQKKQ